MNFLLALLARSSYRISIPRSIYKYLALSRLFTTFPYLLTPKRYYTYYSHELHYIKGTMLIDNNLEGERSERKTNLERPDR